MHEDGFANGWLRPHQTNKQQVADLLAIVEQDLSDSTRDSPRIGSSASPYNAALKLCTILHYAKGCRPENNLAYCRTLQALPLILGNERSNDSDYLDACRVKRDTAEYDVAGTVSQSEADELRNLIRELHQDVVAWLLANHPSLSP